MDFKDEIKKVADDFLKFKGIIRIINYVSSDGICSASILAKTFQRKGINFVISAVKQINDGLLLSLSKEDYDIFIFCDIGSAYVKEIGDYLKNKKVFVFDHHEPKSFSNSVVHLNPFLFGKDGTRDISSAGICYYFSKFFDVKNKDLVYLALVGAVGDLQENDGFSAFNNELLEESKDYVDIKKGLKLFGAYSRDVCKLIESSVDPYIYGVSGNSTTVASFLKEVGVSLTEEDKRKKFAELDEEKLKKICKAMVLKSKMDVKDIYGKIYLLKEGPVKDHREYSTMVNSCVKLNQHSLGMAVCLNQEANFEAASLLVEKYEKEILDALGWFYSNKYEAGQEYCIIDFGNNVRDMLIGVLNTMLVKSGVFEEGCFVFMMADTFDGEIKVSLRKVGDPVNLKKILEKVVSKVGGSVGGYSFGAGAIIPGDKKDKFIELIEADRKVY